MPVVSVELIFRLSNDDRRQVSIAAGTTMPKTLQRLGAYNDQRGLTCVLETIIEEKKKREGLKAKRDLLFERYLKLPMDTHLALEIKVLDDQIAEDAKSSAGKKNRSVRVKSVT